MREIKFRAWNKDQERWYKVDKLQFGEDGIIDVKVWTSGNNSKWLHWAGEDFVIVQYTGLKNKNGKEIYEGDILQKGKNVNGFVEYENGGYHCVIYTKQNAKKQCFHLSLMTREYEVKGNIYENPELMEK